MIMGNYSYISLPNYPKSQKKAGCIENPFELNISVGNYCSIAAKVFACGNGAFHASMLNKKAVSNFPFSPTFEKDYPSSAKNQSIVIKNDVWIGHEAVLMGNITIGNGAIIGTRAIVTKDVPDYGVVVGNPGKLIKYRFTEQQIEKLLQIAWWNWELKVIQERLQYLSDIDLLIEKFG